MKISHLTGLIAVTALVVGCDRNSGGTVDNTYGSSGSGASTNSFQSSKSSSTPVLPDNSGKNVRDRDDATLTPGDQAGNEMDLDITRRIRRAITQSPQLSTTAQNIKIITIDGKVTVRGPVTTEQERELIDSIVHAQGVATVDNQIEVKGTTQ